jgi:purine-binding chemotaxis protein CheW
MTSLLLRGEAANGQSAQQNTAQDELHPHTFLLFRLGARICAVDVGFVREILDVCEILPLPSAPKQVLGTIDLRNQTVGIVDFAARLGLPSTQSEDVRIVVFEFKDDGKDTLLGAMVDQVLGTYEATSAQIEPVAEAISDWRNDGVQGNVRTEDGIALVLDVAQFLGGRGAK